MLRENSYQQLVNRLEALEQDRRHSDSLARQNLRLRRCLGALVIGILLAVFGGSYAPTDELPTIEIEDDTTPRESPRTIVIERLAVVDANGKERIVLGFDQLHKESDEQVPGMYVFDTQGHRRAMLGGDGRTAGLWLAEGGRTRLSMTTVPGKSAGLGIFAEPGSPDRGQIGLYYSTDGNPMLALNDRNGTTRIGMGLFEKGKPAISLTNANGEPIFSQGEP